MLFRSAVLRDEKPILAPDTLKISPKFAEKDWQSAVFRADRHHHKDVANGTEQREEKECRKATIGSPVGSLA